MKLFTINTDIVKLKEVSSTNMVLQELTNSLSLPEGTVILSDFQTTGKGLSTNIWESETGKNLTFSLLLKPKDLLAKDQFIISMAVSNSLIDMLEAFSIKAEIKWPNDILIHLHKVAGILIENSITGKTIDQSIIGIGLNINQKQFPEYEFPASSLRLETNREYNIIHIFTALLNHLEHWINAIYASQYNQVRDYYLQYLFQKNSFHTYLTNHKKFTGKITGINEYGQLEITDQKGKVRYFNFKEIIYVL